MVLNGFFTYLAEIIFGGSTIYHIVIYISLCNILTWERGKLSPNIASYVILELPRRSG